MPESLLVKVRARAAIHARRKVTTVLDGEYGSIHRGRSMEFDDLREYVPGDDIKDIDWKATARSMHPLVRRYVAVRQHAVLAVVDTGRTMAALAEQSSTKRDLAVLATGLIGQLAVRHGDLVGVVAGPVAGRRRPVVHLPPAKGEANLERVLRVIHHGTSADGAPPDVDALLAHVVRHVRRRMIVVVIADDVDIGERRLRLLRRLRAQHEVLMVTIGDLAVSAAPPASREVTTGARLPAFLRSEDLSEELAAVVADRQRRTRAALGALGIAHVRLRGPDDVVADILRLLEGHRRVRR